MALRQTPLLLLGMVLLLGGCCSSHSHTLHYLYTAMGEPEGAMPHFTALGYVDGLLAGYYDSITEQAVSRASWVKKVEEGNPYFWVWVTETVLHTAEWFRRDLSNFQKQENQSGGPHTWQRLYGCELQEDGKESGYDHYAYNGRNFLSFNKASLTWVAADAGAEGTKRKWDAELDRAWCKKIYLEEGCIASLKKYLEYGKSALERKEPPVMMLSSKTEANGMETHTCRAHGFYPKEIDASWRRDGEVWLQDTTHGLVAPNSDGTFHLWLSIQIDPQERDRYRCHIEHDGLQEPLDLALREPDSAPAHLITGVTAAVALLLLLLLLLLGVLVYFKRPKKKQEAASPSERDAASVKQELAELMTPP